MNGRIFRKLLTDTSHRHMVRNGKLMCIRPDIKVVCKQELETELRWEKLHIAGRDTASGWIETELLVLDNYPDYFDSHMLERGLNFYTREIDYLLHAMHRVAYFEGLLKLDNPEIAEDSLCDV